MVVRVSADIPDRVPQAGLGERGGSFEADQPRGVVGVVVLDYCVDEIQARLC